MKLSIGPSAIQGTGCFARRDFAAGEVIGEYTGKVVPEAEATDPDEHTYLFSLDNGMIIDATEEANPVKYINHSCQPNCESEETEEHRVFIRALRPIRKGEELTYDYNLDAEEEHPCSCGAPNCRGTLKGED